ncbi:MAG: cupin domain-containing protein [Eubacteriales bacterium]
MSDKFIKNIEMASVLTLNEQVGYQKGQIVSKTLAQNKAISLTLFAFEKGEEISTHESDGDAMVIALDGTGIITIDGVNFTLNAGETIIMPSNKPHAVFAAEQFKMFLIVIFQ